MAGPVISHYIGHQVLHEDKVIVIMTTKIRGVLFVPSESETFRTKGRNLLIGNNRNERLLTF